MGPHHPPGEDLRYPRRLEGRSEIHTVGQEARSDCFPADPADGLVSMDICLGMPLRGGLALLLGLCVRRIGQAVEGWRGWHFVAAKPRGSEAAFLDGTAAKTKQMAADSCSLASTWRSCSSSSLGNLGHQWGERSWSGENWDQWVKDWKQDAKVLSSDLPLCSARHLGLRSRESKDHEQERKHLAVQCVQRDAHLPPQILRIQIRPSAPSHRLAGQVKSLNRKLATATRTASESSPGLDRAVKPSSHDDHPTSEE